MYFIGLHGLIMLCRYLWNGKNANAVEEHKIRSLLLYSKHNFWNLKSYSPS
jgi:hypothetical protein